MWPFTLSHLGSTLLHSLPRHSPFFSLPCLCPYHTPLLCMSFPSCTRVSIKILPSPDATFIRPHNRPWLVFLQPRGALHPAGGWTDQPREYTTSYGTTWPSRKDTMEAEGAGRGALTTLASPCRQKGFSAERRKGTSQQATSLGHIFSN